MRFREIIEAEIPIETSPDDMRVALDKHYQQGTYLGGGYFGQAFSMPGDIETVDKISRLNQNSWDMDGYYAYINAVKDIRDETHNPFLPQIYNVKRVESTNNSYLLVTIERLYDIKLLEADELRRVFENLIDRTIPDDEVKHLPMVRLYVRDYNSNLTEAWIELIVYLLRDKLPDFKIQNPQLIEAMAIVKKLMSYGYTNDLHGSNIMIRRTKYGPQLVITDPLAFRNSDEVKTRISFAKDQVGF